MRHNIHLGVTGLRQTGKTVFLTSLIYQLSELGSKGLSRFEPSGVTLRAATIEHSRDRDKERFPYMGFLKGLREKPPRWPAPTSRESGLVLRFFYENQGARGKVDTVRNWVGLGKSQGTIALHLHDYPGEYLLDAGMHDMTFEEWSSETMDRMANYCPDEAAEYRKAVEAADNRAAANILRSLRTAYARYAQAARRQGLEFIQPAMTLISWNERCDSSDQLPEPTEDELPFVPLPSSSDSEDESDSEIEQLRKQLTASFDKHKKRRVKPFLKRIRKCNNQLVLVDVLRILQNGKHAYNDTRQCIAEILRAYHTAWKPFGGINRALFAATKADHATKNSRSNMSKLLDALVTKAKGQLKGGIRTPESEWFTSIRVTKDAKERDGEKREVLNGTVKGRAEGPLNYLCGKVPPEWPNDENWVFGNPAYAFTEFEPTQLPTIDGSLWPHVNLDRVIWKILEGCF
ncbi:MAG TPA: hypothetical protein DCE47_17230 [Planctomycetaceae bacterium]|nr:hypothetical protein [Planctomycetaceae bacterium]|tara:strand:- start:1291 stop:2670 length:1380 start_codon:yes stop_codon:yes gene_type:complete